MRATELLKHQHREVEELFARIERAGEIGRAELARELAGKLAAHMRIEEELIYPLLAEMDGELSKEALEEHTIAAFELKRLAEAGMRHGSADAKIKVLEELIQHHVEEEEREALPKLERGLGRDANEELGARAKARFEQILASGYGSRLFPQPRRTKRAVHEAQMR